MFIDSFFFQYNINTHQKSSIFAMVFVFIQSDAFISNAILTTVLERTRYGANGFGIKMHSIEFFGCSYGFKSSFGRKVESFQNV